MGLPSLWNVPAQLPALPRALNSDPDTRARQERPFAGVHPPWPWALGSAPDRGGSQQVCVPSFTV